MGKLSKGLSAFTKGVKEGIQHHKEKDIDYKIRVTEQAIQDQKVNHILHFLLCIPTFGFWLIAWVLITISAMDQRAALKRKLKDLYSIKEQKMERHYQGTPIQSSMVTREERNTPDLTDKDKAELKSLMELKELSVITHDEFEEKKARILNGYA